LQHDTGSGFAPTDQRFGRLLVRSCSFGNR
jgi:hypothetical protein